MSAHERRAFMGGLVVAAVVAVAIALGAGPEHALARGTGAAAIVLLLCSLATSPVASWVAPVWAVALRAARRRLGIASASVALAHAVFAFGTYLPTGVLGPLVGLPWLRHGLLAGLLLTALLLTSFPTLQRALRVRAWSSLHRLAYAAAILASLHAAAVPFGTATLGLAALGLTLVLLVARPLAHLLRRRPAASRDE